jgi:hypothetical protein
LALTEILQARLLLDASQYKSEAKSAAKATDGISGAAQDAGRKGGKGVDSLSGSVKKLGGLVAGAFAVREVAQFANAAIDSAANLGESINAVDVVFGDASQTLHEYGKQAATSVGLAQVEFNELATNSGALLTNFGFTQQQAADESINLTERAADMASVFNTDGDEALFAVQAGLRGETEPLRRFGVSLDDATIRAKAVELGLAATTAEVDKNGKATAALALFYEQTDKVAGDFANTSGSLANQQRIMAAEFENAKAEIGQALLPVMQQLVSIARDLMPSIVEVGKAFGGLVAAAGPLIEIIGRILPKVLGGVASWFKLVGDGAMAIGSIFGDVASTHALRLTEALDNIRLKAEEAELGIGSGQDTYDAFANGIQHLAASGALTAETLLEMADAAGVQGEAAAGAIATNLEFARSNGFAADQVAVLENALLDIIEASDNTDHQKQQLIETYGLEARASLRAKDAAEAAAVAVAEGGDAAEDAASGYEVAASGASQLADELDIAREAQESLSSVLLAAASPAFAAVDAYQKYSETLAKVDEDGVRTAEEQLELAEAILKAQGALDEFSAGGVEKAAASIAETLGISQQAAADLLVELGIIDGFEATALINVGLTGSGASAVSGGALHVGASNVRQHGGPVDAGGTFLVGEAGPELFVPSTSGHIVPNSQLGSGGGGPSAGRVLQVVFNNSRLADDPMEGIRNAMALDALEQTA